MKINLEKVRSLPEKMQPNQPIVFDEIYNMSVQSDPEAVKNLALQIRHHLDIHVDYEMSQLPIQQAIDENQSTKQKLLVQNALKEHSPSHLM